VKIRIVSQIGATLALACSMSCGAQDHGYWQAASNNASAVTGDITLSGLKITIGFKAFPIAPIRDLKPAEVSAVFDADVNTAGPGTLYRLKVPAEQRFEHKNTLCGTQDTQWMEAYVTGKSMQVAFFSGEDAPVFTFDAISHSSNLCGTFTYVR
jgi:hypothetical protein